MADGVRGESDSESIESWAVMASVGLALGVVSGVAIAAEQASTDTIIKPLLEQPLPARSAAVASMVTVEYAPGAGTPPHAHPAICCSMSCKARLKCRSPAAN